MIPEPTRDTRIRWSCCGVAGTWGGLANFLEKRQRSHIRTEDYHQTGYQNHPTTRYSCRERDPSSLQRLEVSGIVAYFVDRTPLVRMQSFHAEPTRTDQQSGSIAKQPARHLLRGSTGRLLRDGPGHLLREGRRPGVVGSRGHGRRIQRRRGAGSLLRGSNKSTVPG